MFNGINGFMPAYASGSQFSVCTFLYLGGGVSE